MKLRPLIRLQSIISCLLGIWIRTAVSYDIYYVERDCRSGNLSISLKDGGPLSAVLLRSTDLTSYSISMDCKIRFTAPDFHRIVVSVLQIGFRYDLKGTCKDYIQIHRTICEDIFRIDEERHFSSDNNTMQMLYHVSKEGLNNSTLSGLPGIKFTVTAIKEKSRCPSSDDKDWFRCDNGYCIWSRLKCDTHNNCGDLSDEQDCDGGVGSKSTVLIILGGLILLLMVIMCIATLLCSKNESVRRFSNRLRSRTLSYLPKFTR